MFGREIYFGVIVLKCHGLDAIAVGRVQFDIQGNIYGNLLVLFFQKTEPCPAFA